MQKQAIHLQWAVFLVALRAVGVAMLCLALVSFIAFHSTPRAFAASASLRTILSSAVSSPSTGPAGTTITVTGSGWAIADGTPVTFGYQLNSSCLTVADSQNGTLSNGNFSGWFRWPPGTPLTTFQVCAMLGTSVMTVAGNFSVLPSNPPAVSISPATLSPNHSATITASNYLPAGTQVNFLWMSGNTIVYNLNSVSSNSSGIAILTFTVPNLSIASGSYSINAYAAGNGQPATLSSSTNFTFHAPVVPPSSTPNPSPTSMPTPTATRGVTPTPTTSVTATVKTSATATAGATPTISASSTATHGSTSGNNGGSNTGTPTTSSSDNTLLIVAAVAIILGLLAGVAAAWLIRRRRKAARAQALAIPPGMPASAAQVPWSNPQGVFMQNGAMLPTFNNNPAGNLNPASLAPYNPGSGPGAPLPQINNIPVPVGAGIATGNENPTITAPADPTLDAMRRQAQAGLFVAPRPYKDERSQ